MGGRALQHYGVFTERKTTKEFNKIGQEIISAIYPDLGVECSVVKCYHNKETHGDLDLLMKIDGDFFDKGIELRKYIIEKFKPQAVHNNGGVYSFDYNKFQVDFIPIKESNWDVALVYFSYDPLGNAMGKTFHKMNLSYGWDGLKYKYRNFNGKNSHDIIISKEPRKIFEFGGFDYDRYLKGFETIEEIFEFIIGGKYFNADIFKMENLNHIDRKRNKKRKSYHEFLEYVENKGVDNKFIFHRDKDIHLPIINDYFPEAKLFKKLDELDERDEINRKLNAKLNGHLIMEWIPGLKGKELGDVIRAYKENLGDRYENVVLSLEPENVKLHFISFYENIYVKQ